MVLFNAYTHSSSLGKKIQIIFLLFELSKPSNSLIVIFYFLKKKKKFTFYKGDFNFYILIQYRINTHFWDKYLKKDPHPRKSKKII